MQLQESSQLHNISGALYLARITQVEEQQRKKLWLYQGRGEVEGEKNVLKSSEELLGEGQEGEAAVRSRRISHNRSILHLVIADVLSLQLINYFHLKNSACSCAKYCGSWGLEGSFHKKPTWDLSMAHFVIDFSDRKKIGLIPFYPHRCVQKNILGWELTWKSPKKASA